MRDDCLREKPRRLAVLVTAAVVSQSAVVAQPAVWSAPTGGGDSSKFSVTRNWQVASEAHSRNSQVRFLADGLELAARKSREGTVGLLVSDQGAPKYSNEFGRLGLRNRAAERETERKWQQWPGQPITMAICLLVESE